MSIDNQQKIKFAMESIEVVDEMISLVEQQFSEVKPQDYEEIIEELGAKLNVLAIQCGLRNEDNLPYKPGTLTWNDFQFGLKVFKVRLGGINRVIPEIGKLRIIKAEASLIIGEDQEVQPLRPEPVPERAGLILNKLKSLQEHEGMLTNDILSWLSRDKNIEIDEKTLRTYLKLLEPYGVKNKPRVGYYVSCSKTFPL